MIDAALAATLPAASAGVQPTAASEDAPAEGFGDVLAGMLAAAAQAAPETPVAAGAATGLTGAGQEDAAQEDAAQEDHAALSTPPPAGQAPAVLVSAAPQPAGRPGQGAPGDPRDAAPRQQAGATAAKVASSAWHAAAQGSAHAADTSAVALSAAPSEPGLAPDAALVPGDTDVAGTSAAGDGSTPGTAREVPPGGASVPGAVASAHGAAPAAPAAAATSQPSSDDGAEQPLTAVGAAPRAEPVPRAEAATRPAPVTAALGSEASPAEATAPAPAAAPPTPVAASTLQRVLDAVEAASHRPPPSTMAVDLPADAGEELVRLLVTVRGDTVTVSGGPSDQGLPPGWARPLAEALAQRGMALEGFASGQTPDRRRRGEPEPAPQGRPADGQAVRPSPRVHDGALRL